MPLKKYPRSWRYLQPILYKKCVERDGELCVDCHKRPVKPGQSISDPARQVKKLEVDHVDGDKNNNPLDAANAALRCHKCNSKKNTRGHAQQAKFNGIARLLLSQEREIANGGLRVETMAMAKNLQAEREFHKFVDTQIKRLGSIKKRRLLNAGVNNFRLKTITPANPEGNTITQQTLARYLEGRTNDINGDLMEDEDAEGECVIKVRI